MIFQAKNVEKQLYYELTTERLAALGTIAYTEGTDRSLDKIPTGYDILYTFRRFIPGTDHPRQRITANGITSTAAGRYQILDLTWDWIQNRLKSTGFKPFPAFSSLYQDQACLFLIDAKRSALKDVDSGSLNRFILKCNKEWASLPGSPYGQPVVSAKKVHEVYSQLVAIWS